MKKSLQVFLGLFGVTVIVIPFFMAVMQSRVSKAGTAHHSTPADLPAS